MITSCSDIFLKKEEQRAANDAGNGLQGLPFFVTHYTWSYQSTDALNTSLKTLQQWLLIEYSQLLVIVITTTFIIKKTKYCDIFTLSLNSVYIIIIAKTAHGVFLLTLYSSSFLNCALLIIN